MLSDPHAIVSRLRQMQRMIRDAVVAARRGENLSAVVRDSDADTIYALDGLIEPVLIEFLEEWGRHTPLVVVAEGLEPSSGRAFPSGTSPQRAELRLILDPIDGTRGLMYDKRSAWSLAGVAPNRGQHTRLRDIEVAVMTELPTSKMTLADVLWAIRGEGAHGVREDLTGRHPAAALPIRPSQAHGIDHGFASVSNFFPGTKVLASRLMEHLARHVIGPADIHRATVFDDQYISTGGQFYELIVGHDRFNADLRPTFYRLQGQPQGLCCHPYDCAALLIAEEAGVIVTGEIGAPLDGPMDLTTGLSWIAYANPILRSKIEPKVLDFLRHPQG